MFHAKDRQVGLTGDMATVEKESVLRNIQRELQSRFVMTSGLCVVKVRFSPQSSSFPPSERRNQSRCGLKKDS